MSPHPAASYTRPERWSDPSNKLFPHQIGLTAPPHDFDAAPTDLLRIAPDGVGVHGRLLHLPAYDHQLAQRADNFHLLEEVVQCFANAGADAVGQVGTNWVHCTGTTPDDIRQFCDRLGDTYQTPFHMAGYCLVEALREIGAETIALNAVYYWPDWRDGIARFLRQAGFNLVWAGNFVDQGLYPTQRAVNDQTWIFPGDLAARSFAYVLEQAPDVDAIIVNGMVNFRRPGDGLPQRMVSITASVEALAGKPVVSSDTALYWRLFKTLGIAPAAGHGRLLDRLAGPAGA